ncbi:MAG: hypothetical protein NVS1B14_12390 [Vulcanimicrobiaceae bacterium]
MALQASSTYTRFFFKLVIHSLRLALILGTQIRAARVLLEWEQTTLARRSKVSRRTIQRLEQWGARPLHCEPETLEKLRSAMERAGITFLNAGEPGVRLLTARKPRSNRYI